MKLCSRHDGEEVCYDGNNCPACQIQQERDDLQDRLNDANKEIESLNEQIT